MRKDAYSVVKKWPCIYVDYVEGREVLHRPSSLPFYILSVVTRTRGLLVPSS
jgi:hypothetical protein